MCGNGTKREVKTFKQSMEWRENRQATIFYNVFSNMEITQTDYNCASAQRAMAKRCVQKGEDLRYKAANLCWPLVGKPPHQRCISGNMDSPISAFRHCVEFVCSGYSDLNSCLALGDELDLCPELPEVSETIRRELDQSGGTPEFSVFAGTSMCDFKPVTEVQVKEILVSAPCKSCALDPIPASVLYECLDELTPERTQTVVAHGHKSKATPLNYGVPQGSVLALGCDVFSCHSTV
ncbi:uncharacterized protein LOC143298271 [Babylonia areolata]|uniref:uncharacterized protein LOC143298271 n=1 Tax=Babylonia areolata TaxID=304850 RepID=UPI003FD11F30